MGFITRAQGRDLVVTFCIVVLLSILGWSLFVTFMQARPQPELQAAMDALTAKDKKRAGEQFDKLLSTNPQSPELYMNVCHACALKEEWALMADYARRGVQECKYEAKEQRAQLYLQLANALAQTEAHPQNEAIAASVQASELDPKNPEVLNNLGYIFADNDMNLDKAQEILTEALRQLRQLPDTVETQLALAETEDSYGWLLYKKGDYQAAIDMLMEGIGDIPENVQLGKENRVWHYHLGAAYRMAGQVEQARCALAVALQYDPDYAPAKNEMATLPPPTPKSAVTSPVNTSSTSVGSLR